jgi:peptide/nickel transport system substrate-binding protein
MKRGVLLVALACACCRAPGAGPGDRPIEMIVSTDAETLDPRYAGDAVALRATRLIHAGLVRLDPSSLRPEPYLARGFRWVDPLTLRVELRDDVRFHSGALFSSADVVATLRAFGSPAVGSRHASIVDAIASAEADGPHAVIITLKRPHATLLTDLELPILRADQAAGPADAHGTLDGLGPFAVKSFARGELVLSPADTGASPRPLHAVVIRTVRDENARALRLHAGRADVALNVLSPTLLPALGDSRELRLSARPGANLTYMVMRVDRPPLDDVRVRRAISLAIDRAGIARTLLAGYAQAADTLLPPALWAYTPATSPLAFDPAEARRLLRDAGLSRLRVTLLTSTDRLRGTIARYLAQELAEAGVELEVTPLELGTMLARLAAGDFDAATLQIPEVTEPNVLRVFMLGSLVPPMGANRGRIHDAAIDSLLEEGDRATSQEARMRLYADLEARNRDELFLIPLWHEDQVTVTSERARAFVPSAEGRWLSLASLP